MLCAGSGDSCGVCSNVVWFASVASIGVMVKISLWF